MSNFHYKFASRPPYALLAYDGPRFEADFELSFDEFMFTFAVGKTYTAFVLSLALGPLSLNLRYDLYPEAIPFDAKD